MARKTHSDITGDIGENLVRLLLCEIAIVNKYVKDEGIDFFCEPRDDPESIVFVQAKGSSNPHYSETFIQSLPVKCKTIKQYWLKMPFPVFVFMADTSQKKTYYTIVNYTTYRPKTREQKTYTFSIPLSNQVTPENISAFIAMVNRNKIEITPEERKRLLDHHIRSNPFLYNNPDNVEQMLEIMRGGDQSPQVELKLFLKQQYDKGISIPLKLREGLISIFKNSRDRIVQIHTLDTLIYINEESIIPEIIKQINRNIRYYEYYSSGGRIHDIEFLFRALVRLKAVDTLGDLIEFLNSKDPNIILCAARTSGELHLKETEPYLICLLSHDDDNVRHTVTSDVNNGHETFHAASSPA